MRQALYPKTTPSDLSLKVPNDFTHIPLCLATSVAIMFHSAGRERKNVDEITWFLLLGVRVVSQE